MSANTVTNDVSTAAYVVDDAVGVEKSHWYVAIVNHNTEKKVAEKLGKMNIQHYLPSQTEFRIWKNGRRSKVDRLVIPSIIFVYCTERKRREIVGLPFINRFMTNPAGTNGDCSHKPLAIIPEKQIETLKFMLGQNEMPVEIIGNSFKTGDNVRVRRGKLIGLKGTVLDMNRAKSEFFVAINILGYARLIIDTMDIEKI